MTADVERLTCGYCGDRLLPSEIEGHLNSEGRTTFPAPSDAVRPDPVAALVEALPANLVVYGKQVDRDTLANFIADGLAIKDWMLVHRSETVPVPSDAVRAALEDDPEGQGMAFRAMGEAITEIGLRQISGPLTEEDIAAVSFLARNVLSWCGDEAALRLPAAAPLDVPTLARAMQEVHHGSTVSDRSGGPVAYDDLTPDFRSMVDADAKLIVAAYDRLAGQSE